MATATKDVSLNKKVSQFFWRSWAIQASWNYERQMNMGFLYGMVPTLDRLYPDESDPRGSSLLRKKLTTVTWRSTTAPRRRALSSRASPPPWRRSTPGSENFDSIRSARSRPPSWVRFPASVTPSSGHHPRYRLWPGRSAGSAGLHHGPDPGHAHLHRPLCADHLVRSQDGLSGRTRVPEQQASGRRPHGEAHVCLRHRGSYVRGRHDRYADRRYYPAAVR